MKGVYENFLIVAGFPLLLGFYLAAGVGVKWGIPNVFWIAPGVVVASMLVLGSKAMARTPFDIFFVIWAALALGSHIFATEVLKRGLDQGYLFGNLAFIFSMAALYRAVFCLILLNPKYSTRALFITLGSLLVGAVVIGLMEKFGPGKDWAMKFSALVSPLTVDALDAASVDRPSSIFAGPNLLGYADTVLACIALGWGFTETRRTSLWKAAAVIVLICLAIFSAFVAQTRSTIILLLVFPVIYGIQLRRKAADQRTVMLFIALLFAAVIGIGSLLESGKFSYIKEVSQIGLAKDPSYRVRLEVLHDLERVAVEIAPFGTGVGQANSRNVESTTGFSRYNSIGIDNEWANAYQEFGVWGPLFVGVFALVWWRQSVMMSRDGQPESRLAPCIAVCLLLSMLLLSPSAVRLLKYETSGYTFVLLAAVSAWKLHRESLSKPLLNS